MMKGIFVSDDVFPIISLPQSSIESFPIFSFYPADVIDACYWFKCGHHISNGFSCWGNPVGAIPCGCPSRLLLFLPIFGLLSFLTSARDAPTISNMPWKWLGMTIWVCNFILGNRFVNAIHSAETIEPDSFNIILPWLISPNKQALSWQQMVMK